MLGARRQHGYGNVRVRDGLVLGIVSPLGVAGGVAISNAVPERTLELLFAGLALVIATQLVRRGIRPRTPASDSDAVLERALDRCVEGFRR